ncbi:MAG: hypothetical protein WC565_09520, partial [Parcubacteria group bacterium]
SVDFFGIGSEVYSSFLGWGLTLYYDHEATPWDSLGVDSSQVFSALFDRSKERVQLTGAHIHWVSEYYTNREVYGTFPWADTSTWATHLINIVDTAGDETATRIPFPTTWIVDVPCSVTTNLLVYQAATSYASMDSAGVDSAYLYVNGTKVDSASVDFSPGTTVGTDTLIMGAGRTLNVGDDVTVLWVLTTTPSATDPYVRIKNAAIERWRR